ncbi:glycoside hydrolase family 16 protein [Mrakia frigida]|uniref:glycoside hydrolase family 16 protein n=1 Tax=Mrakia frigida TaxID=29902 RepID=UPI003FCC14F6
MSLSSFSTVLAVALSLSQFAPSAQATSYPLVQTFSGTTFFDDWTYYGAYDNTTLGDVIWVNETVGVDSTNPLTYTNTAGNAIVKVDNTTTVGYNLKRNSVRLASKNYYAVGSVFVFDALHLPYGCSVWPAWWSTGADWPAGGEIDTFEGVNQQTNNQMALHTESGCTQATSVTQSGTTNSTTCDTSLNDNAGCAVTDSSDLSYGAPFAAAGGGVWVTELASTGINIWFFTRADVPTSISSATSSLDTSNLGTPSATWPQSSCDVDSYFGSQQLILDITLCGSWAGAATTLEETCPALSGTATCYSTYVADGSNYDDAYVSPSRFSRSPTRFES